MTEKQAEKQLRNEIREEKIDEKLEVALAKEEALDEKLETCVVDAGLMNFMQDQFQNINEYESEIDAFYHETKEHFDAVKNSRMKGSFNFITTQTTNLIALKREKMGCINARSNLKKYVNDVSMKKAAASQGDGADAAQIANELMKALNKRDFIEGVYDVIEEVQGDVGGVVEDRVKELEEAGEITYSESEKDPNAVLNVDAVIRQLIEDEGKEETDDDQATEEIVEVEEIPDHTEELPEGAGIAVGLSHDRQRWAFIAMNFETGEVLDIDDDYLPDESEHTLKLMRVGGELKALLSDGNYYHVITMEIEYDDELEEDEEDGEEIYGDDELVELPYEDDDELPYEEN